MNSQEREEAEGVVGEHHEVHAGEERRIERQHAHGRVLVAAMTEREQARRDSAKIDDHEKEGRKRVHAEMSAEPRQPEGQCRRRRCGATDELEQRGSAGHGADQERAAIDQPPAPCRPAHQNGNGSESEKCGNRGQSKSERHRGLKPSAAYCGRCRRLLP